MPECPYSTLLVLIAWMRDNPSRHILEIAYALVDIYGSENVPDYVNALANGNPDVLDDVIAVALADYQEEVQRASEL